MPQPILRRLLGACVSPVAAVALLSGCTSAAPVTTAPSERPGSPDGASAPATPSTDGTAPADGATASDEGPAEAFRTWLVASRLPDTATACAYLTPELAQRMVDEIAAEGVTGVTDCPSLVTATAALYEATGQTAEVDVEVLQQSPTEAVLDVVYLDGGSCGTVVLEHGPSRWVITEQSQKAC